MTESSELRINMFNGLEIATDLGHPPKFSSLRAKVILAWLAMNPGQHQREMIATLLWDERSHRRSLGNLRTLLARLPKPVKGFLQISAQTIGLDPQQTTAVDLLRFDRLVEDSDLPEAAALLLGEPLAGVYVEESEGLYEWMWFLREAYNQKGINLLQTLAESAPDKSKIGEAILYAQRLVQLDPLREESYRLLMRLLAHNGQKAEALNIYESCKQMLKQEFAVEPEAATIALAGRLKSGNRPRHNLAKQPNRFIGRKQELAILQEMIISEGGRLVTIMGPGGIGKTRLAVQFGKQVLFHFLDGIIFVPLSGIEQAGQVLLALIGALQENSLIPPLTGKRRALQHLQEHLKYMELLLILDNFEHVLHAKDALDNLLAQASGVKILVTSRLRLHSRWERVLELQGLQFPQKVREADWQQYDAVQLFIQAAERAFPGIIFNLEDQRAVSQICQQVGSMPLALELAANWLQVHTPAEIAQKIDDGVRFLFDSGADLPPRQRSLQAVFDVSWDQLSAADQAVLAQLSVFRGGFDREAAVFVSGISDQQLLALNNRALLYREAANGQSGRVHFALHPLLREFAWQKLAAGSQQFQETQTNHARCYLERVAAFDKRRREDNLLLDRFVNKNIHNVRSAWKWATGQEMWDLLQSASEQIFNYYDRNGPNQEGLDHFKSAARAASQQGAPEVSCQFRLHVIRFLVEIGDFEEANREIETILSEISMETHPAAAELFILWGELLFDQSSYELAKEKLQIGLEMAAAQQSKPLIADAKRVVSQIAADEGQFDVAESSGREALVLYEHLGNSKGLAMMLNLLAAIARMNEDFDTAIQSYRRSIELCEDSGEYQAQFIVMRNLSLALGRVGRFDEAMQYIDGAIDGYTRYGSIWGRATTLYMKGVLASNLGRYRWAERIFKTTLELNKQSPQKRVLWFLYGQLAMLYENWGQPLLAIYYAREALNLTQEEKDRYSNRIMHMALGYALLGKGEAESAKGAFDDALSLTDGIGSSNAIVELEAGIIEAMLLVGQSEKAWQLALDLRPRISPKILPACIQPFRVYLTVYRAMKKNEPRFAENILEEALLHLANWEQSITDERSRETFRTAVPAHRALLEYGKKL